MRDEHHCTRRAALLQGLGLTALALPALPRLAGATEPFPVKGKPIRIVVGMAGGAGVDAMLRIVAVEVSKDLQTPVVVDNKPGAAMMLAAMEVKRAAPDGYTLMFAPSTVFAQNPHTQSQIKYDPFDDFSPISLGARGPLVLVVHDSLGVKTVPELIALGRKRPQGFIVGSFGVGTSSHVYAEMFAKKTGIPIVHVPFKGGTEIAKDFLPGRIDMIFDAASPAIQNARTGRVHIIGVGAAQRSPLLPGVPTLTEQGLAGMDLSSWIGFFGPAGMRPEVTERLNASLRRALATPEVVDFYRRGAYEPEGSTPDQLTRTVRDSYDSWGAAIREIGMPKQ